MARDDELDRLFEKKQDAWQEQDRARQRMNDAWDELQRLRDRYGSRIDSLRAEHSRLYEQTQGLSRDIDSAFNYGDRDEGFRLIEKAKEVHAEMQLLPGQWRGMVAEIKDAQSRHERPRDEFRTAKRNFIEANDAFKDRKNEIRAAKEDALSIAAIPVQYREGAVLRNNPDGSLDVFFGGIGPDQLYHGHYHFESNGEITYRREPFQDHGPQNHRGSDYRPEYDTPQRRQSERNQNRNKRYKGEYQGKW
jgi:chromosome segregation ATPase